MSAGFPNFFIIDGPGSPCTFFQPILLSEVQARWLGDTLDRMRKLGISAIEPCQDAEERWVSHCKEVSDMTLFNLSDNWYIGANTPGKARVMMTYVGGGPEYMRRLDETQSSQYAEYTLSEPATA